jgi:hypothetical protein
VKAQVLRAPEAPNNRLRRLALPLSRGVGFQVMDQMTCCKDSCWEPERDLGHAGGFDYLLGKCGRCGTPWMNVFCIATSRTGYEPVTVSDLERMRSTADDPDFKEFMRDWGEKNLWRQEQDSRNH